MAVYRKDIPDDTIDASLQIGHNSRTRSWVVIEQQKFAVHEIRVALATVHEYIEDDTTDVCIVYIDYKTTELEHCIVSVYDGDDTINVSIGYKEPTNSTAPPKTVELPLSEFLSIVQFVSDFLS